MAVLKRRAWSSESTVTTGNVFVPRVSTLYASWDDPPRSLEAGPNLQTWRLAVRKSKPWSTDPIVKLELLDESGVVLDTPIADVPVSSTTPVILAGTWDASVFPFLDGSGARMLLTSINTKGRTRVDVAALQWQPVLGDVVAVGLGMRWNVRRNVASSPLSLRWNILESGALYPTEALYPSETLYPGGT